MTGAQRITIRSNELFTNIWTPHQQKLFGKNPTTSKCSNIVTRTKNFYNIDTLPRYLSRIYPNNHPTKIKLRTIYTPIRLIPPQNIVLPIISYNFLNIYMIYCWLQHNQIHSSLSKPDQNQTNWNSGRPYKKVASNNTNSHAGHTYPSYFPIEPSTSVLLPLGTA